MTDNEQYVPKGHFVREDADGERFVKKDESAQPSDPQAQARKLAELVMAFIDDPGRCDVRVPISMAFILRDAMNLAKAILADSPKE